MSAASPAARWGLAIGALLGANALAMVALAVSANRGGGAQVIPAYYERAARYDDEIDRAAASRALGWRVAVAVRAGQVVVEARDAVGAPVSGARVELRGYHRAHAAEPIALAPTAIGPGDYAAAAPARAGRHDLTLQIERGAARFVERVTLEVP